MTALAMNGAYWDAVEAMLRYVEPGDTLDRDEIAEVTVAVMDYFERDHKYEETEEENGQK